MQGSFERINDSPTDRNNRTIQTNVTVKYGSTKKEERKTKRKNKRINIDNCVLEQAFEKHCKNK